MPLRINTILAILIVINIFAPAALARCKNVAFDQLVLKFPSTGLTLGQYERFPASYDISMRCRIGLNGHAFRCEIISTTAKMEEENVDAKNMMRALAFSSKNGGVSIINYCTVISVHVRGGSVIVK